MNNESCLIIECEKILAKCNDDAIGKMLELLLHISKFINDDNVVANNLEYLTINGIAEVTGVNEQSVRRSLKVMIKNDIAKMINLNSNKVIMLNPSLIRKSNDNIESLKEVYDKISVLCAAKGRNCVKWTEAVLTRDNYTCQCCGSKSNLEAHHIYNYSQYKELREDVDNGITLCERCHNPLIAGSFHNVYGVRNNTKEQLEEYFGKYRDIQKAIQSFVK